MKLIEMGPSLRGAIIVAAVGLVVAPVGCRGSADANHHQYAEAETGTKEAATESQEDAKLIEEGSSVSIEYTLKLDDGTKVDTNVGGDPLEYTQGQGQIIPGLEREMVGLKEGDTKSVKVAPKDGYGEVDPEHRREVEVQQVPEQARQVGAMLSAEGHNMPIRVHEVRDDKIVLDFNHPLAGQTLNFDIKVLSVK